MFVRSSRAWLFGVAAALALPTSALAQTIQLPAETSPLNAIKRLFCANFDNTTPSIGGAVITPVSTNLVNEFLFQSQTFPNASSSAGFTFTWSGGAPVASELYGPLFGERALTNGKGKLSATLNYQRLAWSTLDGQKIRADQLGLSWGDLDPVGLKPSDPYTGICKLNVNSDVVLFGLNYGLFRKVDVSAAVPWVHTSVSGTSEFNPASSVTVGNLPTQTYAASGDASGIGDIGFAVKAEVVDSGAFHVALRGGAALGTGSADKMTGTGQNIFNGMVAATWEQTPVSFHGQVGYSVASGESDPASPLSVGVFDEFDYVVGLDYTPVPERVTVGTELVARRLLNTPGFNAQTLTAVDKDITVYFFSIGGKVRVVQRVLFTAYMLLPAGNSGLLPNKPSFNAGLNYVF
jgi:hypothetical protein